MADAQTGLFVGEDVLDTALDQCVYRAGGGWSDAYEENLSLFYHPTDEKKGIFYFVSRYSGGRIVRIHREQVFWFLNYLKSHGIEFNQSFDLFAR